MRIGWYPRALRGLFLQRPSVGQLMDLCEENYRYLLRLAPDVRTLQGRYLSRRQGTMDLHLEVLEQTPYTTLLQLTYHFSQEYGSRPDPAAKLRVYHDSGQAEVLELRQRILPLNRGREHPTLDQKWKVNLFLSKWLSYCVGQGHRFSGFGLPMGQPDRWSA